MSWNNLNNCLSVTLPLTSSLTVLSSFKCSEVLVLNLGSTPLRVWDVNSTFSPSLSDTSCFIVPPSADYTFRGLTDCNQLSAAFITGSGTVSFRMQFFSSFPLTVY